MLVSVSVLRTNVPFFAVVWRSQCEMKHPSICRAYIFRYVHFVQQLSGGVKNIQAVNVLPFNPNRQARQPVVQDLGSLHCAPF